jgi:septal ring factor EnvC (AmiA/AmiB activator)
VGAALRELLQHAWTYLIAFSIWNWKQTVDFYNEYTDPTRAENRRLRKENANLESAIKEVTRERDAAADTLNNVNSQLQKSETACEKLTERVIALKARLYDLMTAGD